MGRQRKMASEKNHPYLSQSTLSEENNNNVWLASTIQIFRNIEKFKFPAKLESDRQNQIITVLGKELLNSNLLEAPALFRSDEVTPSQKEFLMEHYLSAQGFHPVHSSEAFVLEKGGNFLGILNANDHMNLRLLDFSTELELAWNKLLKIETAIGKAVNYAYTPRFGFMTSDPNLSGTALLVSTFLQIPALIHLERIDDTLEKYNDEAIYVSGLQGNPTEVIGDVLVIQNNFSLGVNEETIFAAVRGFTSKLLVEETSARNEIKQKENSEIKDRISRAYGILIHSYNIEAIEALNAISLLKLGQDLGWISGITNQQLNKLFFNCRRAHLLAQYEEKISQEQILHKRAEYIHKMLKDVKLMI